ncbi:MAG: hypothetical protein LBP32_08575, partial [Spirochaetaceae bacterium]|nr:hypothetical protein [Spirochaetaceae bacterium]
MMNNKGAFFLIIVFISGAAIMVVDFLVLLFFRSPLVSPAQLAVRVGIPGIFFMTVYNALLG